MTNILALMFVFASVFLLTYVISIDPIAILQPTTEDGANFGYAMDQTDDWLFVSANLEHNNEGRVYIYPRLEDGLCGSLHTTLSPPEGSIPSASNGIQFGTSVAGDNTWLCVGARYQSFEADSQGAAHFYRYDDTSDTWSHTQTTTIDTANTYFGYIVTMSWDYAVISGYKAPAGGFWVMPLSADGDSWDDPILVKYSYSTGISLYSDGSHMVLGAPYAKSGSVSNIGCSYAFSMEEDNWWKSFPSKMKGDLQRYSDYGYQSYVDAKSRMMVVTEPYYDSSSRTDCGRVYLYTLHGTNSWKSLATLSNPSTSYNDRFGYRAAVAGEVGFVSYTDNYDHVVAVTIFSDLTGKWSSSPTTTRLNNAYAPDTTFGISLQVHTSDDSRQYSLFVGASGSPVIDQDTGDVSGTGVGAVFIYQEPFVEIEVSGLDISILKFIQTDYELTFQICNETGVIDLNFEHILTAGFDGDLDYNLITYNSDDAVYTLSVTTPPVNGTHTLNIAYHGRNVYTEEFSIDQVASAITSYFDAPYHIHTSEDIEVKAYFEDTTGLPVLSGVSLNGTMDNGIQVFSYFLTSSDGYYTVTIPAITTEGVLTFDVAAGSLVLSRSSEITSINVIDFYGANVYLPKKNMAVFSPSLSASYISPKSSVRHQLELRDLSGDIVTNALHVTYKWEEYGHEYLTVWTNGIYWDGSLTTSRSFQDGGHIIFGMYVNNQLVHEEGFMIDRTIYGHSRLSLTVFTSPLSSVPHARAGLEMRSYGSTNNLALQCFDYPAYGKMAAGFDSDRSELGYYYTDPECHVYFNATIPALSDDLVPTTHTYTVMDEVSSEYYLGQIAITPALPTLVISNSFDMNETVQGGFGSVTLSIWDANTTLGICSDDISPYLSVSWDVDTGIIIDVEEIQFDSSDNTYSILVTAPDVLGARSFSVYLDGVLLGSTEIDVVRDSLFYIALGGAGILVLAIILIIVVRHYKKKKAAAKKELKDAERPEVIPDVVDEVVVVAEDISATADAVSDPAV
eukprot:gnl/Dysnectes_brevis/3916_a5095_849.p1 GENE.gnl/Dysnectes_brevis/3916_a5095_849~~gnl/Dysnectes_brevis/3916_a5095_849.p1  ORF type:complete len:1023 (-),score=227.15 gnl/Dysnectes_brevis/3916_a5095_849:92-3133(-)